MNAPIDIRARVFAAFCDDLAEGTFRRVDALREINRQSLPKNGPNPAGRECGK